MTTQVRSSSPTVADRLKDVVHYAEVKRLVDNIMLQQRKKPFRSLAVLSLFPGEGKTLFSALMAIAYAEAGTARALAVDTTTQHHPSSLTLKQCLDGASSSVDFVSLEEYRRTMHTSVFRERRNEETIRAEIVEGSVNALVKRESDQFLIWKLAEERASQYELIVLDTAPLSARNKGNIDPMLVARIADASVLVVNPHRLDASSLETHIKILHDPALHLLGIVSNEECLL